MHHFLPQNHTPSCSHITNKFAYSIRLENKTVSTQLLLQTRTNH